jgi:NADH-quinone oxidoreductase subunit M
MPDLNRREYAMLASIAAVVLWMGVYPESFMAPMRKDVGILLERIDRAKPAGDAQLTKGAPRPAADPHGAHAAPASHDAPAAGAGAH